MIDDVYWENQEFRLAMLLRATTRRINGFKYCVVRNPDNVALAFGPREGCNRMAEKFKGMGVGCRVVNASQHDYHWRKIDGKRMDHPRPTRTKS